jgi:hypothetical protein
MITSANLAQAIVKLIATRVPAALQGVLVMGNLVNRDFEPVLATVGDTVNVPLPPTLVANNIAEGGSVTVQNASPGNAQVTLNNHPEATFEISDIARVLASPDLLSLYMNPAMIAIAESIETSLLSLYPVFTANALLGGASTIDEARIDGAETALFNAKVPVTEPKFLVVSGASYGSMRQLSRFTEMQTAGNGQALATGNIGTIKSFTVIRSQFVQYVTDRYKNMAFARDAMALAMRRLPAAIPGTGAVTEYAEIGGFGLRITMSYNPTTLSQKFTVDCLYGVSALRNTFCQVVESI